MPRSRSTRHSHAGAVLLRELLTIVIGLALGLVALPAAIYYAGSRALGSYGGDGPPDLYGALYRDLLHLEPAALLIALLPLGCLYVIRLLLLPWRRR